MSTTNATLSTFAQSLANIANNLAASANSINMGTVGIVQSANDLAKLATEISVASVEKVEEKKPEEKKHEIAIATNDIKAEFENEPNFYPRAFQLIDCKTMEKAFYYLQNGIHRKEIVRKFNLDITLSFESHFVAKHRVSSSQRERMGFYAAFFKMVSVSTFFKSTMLTATVIADGGKYSAYRNSRKNRKGEKRGYSAWTTLGV